MKTQMRFQKILCLVSLILGAVAIVYSFAFFTGGLATISDLYVGYSRGQTLVGDIYLFANDVNTILLILGIVYILMVALLYIFACHKRRNYYKDSIIVTIIAAAYIAVYGVLLIALAAAVHAQFAGLDWDTIDTFMSTRTLQHTGKSPVMFIIGYVFGVIALANAGAIVYNLIWKLKLMKGEKELLANGLVKEVA